jgi:two-component system, OmpR family, response regulator
MPTLLLVDDDSAVRDIFSLFLTKQGFEVHTADGGEACIAALGTLTPDLILLDIMMEPMDGWQTLLAVKTNPETRSVPVMIVTAKPPTRDEIRNYGGYIDGFVMKPAEFKSLPGSVSQAIETNAQMNRAMQELQDRGIDPDRVLEYISLLRQVRITQKLSGRFQNYWNTDVNFLMQQESRLARLEQDLGISPPDNRIREGDELCKP